MKVFISFSGEVSKRLASALHEFVGHALHAVKPFMSQNDIETGMRWSTRLNEELEATDVGILCLTPDNLDARWINYEAGALAKDLEKSRVCTCLYGLKRGNLRGPLEQFQACEANEEGIRELLTTINNALKDEQRNEAQLATSFKDNWRRFAKRISELPEVHAAETPKQSDGALSQMHDVGSSGITGYVRNYGEYYRGDFSNDCRNFVIESPFRSEFKVVGIDWTELFGETHSRASEQYEEHMKSGSTFKVILLDPRCQVGYEKRLSEYELIVGDGPRYKRDLEERVYRKIFGSTQMMAKSYHKIHPQQFQYQFISELPAACCLMNGKQIIFHPYSRCHKGWDSPVFVADRAPGGIYEFFEQYFDFLWENPLPVVSSSDWETFKGQLKLELQNFEGILAAACPQDDTQHENCPKSS